jgi:hypothetical protein
MKTTMKTRKTTTTMETHGCELAGALVPSWVKKQIKKMGFRNPIIRVPIRQKGKTSTGRPLFCHINSKWIAERIGGERLVGYEIYRSDKDCCIMNPHSVWITPEGRTVDCTQRPDEHMDIRGTPRNPQECLFLPVSTDDNLHLRPVRLVRPIKRTSPKTQVGAFFQGGREYNIGGSYVANKTPKKSKLIMHQDPNDFFSFIMSTHDNHEDKEWWEVIDSPFDGFATKENDSSHQPVSVVSS